MFSFTGKQVPPDRVDVAGVLLLWPHATGGHRYARPVAPTPKLLGVTTTGSHDQVRSDTAAAMRAAAVSVRHITRWLP